MFYVGQKVCFVGDEKASLSEYRRRCEHWRGIMPTYGEVYTIRGITLGTNDEPHLLLIELDNSGLPKTSSGVEPGYPARCFRPVVDRKTDISIFTDMLAPKTEQVSA